MALLLPRLLLVWHASDDVRIAYQHKRKGINDRTIHLTGHNVTILIHKGQSDNVRGALEFHVRIKIAQNIPKTF